MTIPQEFIDAKIRHEERKTQRAIRSNARFLAKRKKVDQKKERTKKQNQLLKKKNDVRNTKEYKEIKRSVLKKADGVCQMCNKRPEKLYVHHIEQVCNEPSKAKDFNNLVAICLICHAEIHPWLR